MPYAELLDLGRDGLTGLLADDGRGEPEVVWLLEIEWAGRTWRWSTHPIEVATRDGSSLPFGGGLDPIDIQRAMQALADAPDLLSVSVEVHWPIDVAALVQERHDLAGATGSLSVILRGQEYEERAVLVRGCVSQPEYGYDGDPVAFSLVEEPYDDRATWPPAQYRVTADTWPDASEAAEGATYPTVIGCPGIVRTDGGWRHVPAARALPVEVAGLDSDAVVGTVLVAGHPVLADSIMLWWYGGSLVADGQAAFEVEHQDDDLGTTCAVVDVSAIGTDATEWWASWDSPVAWAIAVTWSPGTVYAYTIDGYTVTWTSGGAGNATLVAIQLAAYHNAYRPASDRSWAQAYAGGILRIFSLPGQAYTYADADANLAAVQETYGLTRGGAIRHGRAVEGAGEVALWWLDRSTLRVDRGRWEALAHDLDPYRIGAVLDEPVVPWEWLADNLLPILPVSIHHGEDGLYPVLWRWDATREEAVALLEAAPGLVLVGRVRYDARPRDLASAARLRYAYDYRRREYLSEAAELPVTRRTAGDGTTSSYHASVSATRYGQEQAEHAVSTDVVYARATADLVAHDLVMRRAYAHRVATYQAQQEWAWLALGDVVLLTDAGLHLDEIVALVVGWRLLDVGGVELELQLVEDVARDALTTGPDPTGSDYDPGPDPQV